MEARYRLLLNSRNLFNECKWNHFLVNCTKEEIMEMLYNVYYILNKLEDVRINYTSDNITIFANDLSVINEFKVYSTREHIKSVTEAHITLPQNAIFRKNSEFKYRMYLKEGKVQEEAKHNMRQFFFTYEKYIRIGEGLKYWLFHSLNFYMQRHYFIDTCDEDLPKVFDLICPGARYRTYKIISDKYKE